MEQPLPAPPSAQAVGPGLARRGAGWGRQPLAWAGPARGRRRLTGLALGVGTVLKPLSLCLKGLHTPLPVTVPLGHCAQSGPVLLKAPETDPQGRRLEFQIGRPEQQRHHVQGPAQGEGPLGVTAKAGGAIAAKGHLQAHQVGGGRLGIQLALEHGIEQGNRQVAPGDPQPEQLPIDRIREVAQPSLQGPIEGLPPGQQAGGILGQQGVLGLPARRIRDRAESAGLAQKVKTKDHRPLVPRLQRVNGLGREGGIPRAIGACVVRPPGGLALARWGWAQFRVAWASLAGLSSTRASQAGRLPAQSLGCHGKQGLEELEVIGRAWGARGPLAAAAGTRRLGEGRAPRWTGARAGGLRAWGLARRGARRGRGSTGLLRRRGRGSLLLPRASHNRIGLRIIANA